jgi:hypothetical protein
MSEQSGGPGWWQASDGKWYPPEQAPTAAQPTADPTATQPAYGAPAAGAPAAGVAAAGGGGASKVIGIVVVLALLAGGGAYLLTKGGGGGSKASFCDTTKKFKDDAQLNNAFDDPSKIDKVVAAFDQLTKSAPSEIKADMNTLNDAIKKIGAAVKQAGNDPSKAFGAILAAGASLDQAKFTQAQKNVEKFAKDKCGIDLSSSSSSDSFSFSSFTFDSSSFSSFGSSSFDSSSFDSSLSSEASRLCSQFGTQFGSDFCSSS